MNKDTEKIQELIDKHGFFETGPLISALQEAITFGRESTKKQYQLIFDWLQGMNGDFPDLSQKPHYRFRTELRKRLEDLTP